METGVLSSFLRGVPYHHSCSGYERLIDFIKPKRVYHSLVFRRMSRLLHPMRLAHIMPRYYESAEAERRALQGDFEL